MGPQPDERVAPPAREHDAQEAADGREHDALGQPFADEPHAARSEGGPDRQALLPRESARHEQARHVGAGDEQEQSHRPEQQQQGAARVAHDLLLQRDETDAPAAVFSMRTAIRPRLLPFHPGGEPRQLRADRRGRDAGRQTSEHAQRVRGPVLPLLLGESEGKPQLGALRMAEARMGKREPRGHHPHDGVRPGVEHHRLAEDGTVAAETAPPETVADHHHVVVPGPLVVLPQRAPEPRRRAQHRKQRRRDPRPHDALRFGAAGEVEAHVAKRGHSGEQARPLPVLEILGNGRAHVAHAQTQEVAFDEAQLVHRGIGERAQQGRVHDAEDGGGRADSEAEDRDHEGREPRRP